MIDWGRDHVSPLQDEVVEEGSTSLKNAARMQEKRGFP